MREEKQKAAMAGFCFRHLLPQITALALVCTLDFAGTTRFMIKAGTSAEPGETAAVAYILNSNTHKFHYPQCASVYQIKEANKVPFYGDRAEVIEMGYSPCGRCKP